MMRTHTNVSQTVGKHEVGGDEGRRDGGGGGPTKSALISFTMVSVFPVFCQIGRNHSENDDILNGHFQGGLRGGAVPG